MKKTGGCRSLLAFLLLTGALAAEAMATECKQINAQIISYPVIVGCASPVNLCTSGIIDGNQGLNGTTFFTADSIAQGPLTAPDSPETISFSGLLEIKTDHGTLMTRHSGVFNTSVGKATSGFFSSFDEVIAGAGRYQGATGFLYTGGRNNEGQFKTFTITGNLCLP